MLQVLACSRLPARSKIGVQWMSWWSVERNLCALDAQEEARDQGRGGKSQPG